MPGVPIDCVQRFVNDCVIALQAPSVYSLQCVHKILVRWGASLARHRSALLASKAARGMSSVVRSTEAGQVHETMATIARSRLFVNGALLAVAAAAC